MVNFAPLDWAITLLFFAGIFLLGFSAKLRESTAVQFVAAGRAVTLPIFVTGLVATWYGGILGVGESVLYYGLGAWLLIGVPYYVFAAIYAIWFAKRVRTEDQISIPERLANRFGKTSGVLGATLVLMIGLPAAHVLMLGTLVQAFTGWDIKVCVILGALGGSIFLYKGGLLADLRVSILAFIMMYVGFAVIVVYCNIHYPIGQTWVNVEPKSLLTWNGGQGPLVILTFFILGAWTLIDPGFHQRVAAAESPETGRKGIWICIACWAVFDILSISAAMYGISLLSQADVNPMSLYPRLGELVLPSGLKAIFICGMAGTILCAMVSYALVGGASIGRDIAARLKPSLDVTKSARWGILACTILAIVLALQLESVVAIWYAWGGIVVGALLIPVSWSYLSTKPMNAKVVNSAMVLAAASSLGWMIYCYSTGNTLLAIKVPSAWLGYTGTNSTDASAYADLGIGTLLPGLLVSAIVTFVGKLITTRTSHDGPA